MRLIACRLAGAYRLVIDPIEDERGFFARSFCAREAQAVGIDFKLAQSNVSFNRTAGTLRGLHYQAAPHQEAKIVRCTRGAAFDVLVDLRAGSPTHGQWEAVELSESNRESVFIPEGIAHGFQTLQDDTELLYLMSQFYHPESARGVRWDDPDLAIRWPIAQPILSPRDAAFPGLRP
jgi:dTDP-4-dehydrorhamnose 3,5-epimerase